MLSNKENAMEVVDIAFRIQGTTIPVDHGYLLYSSLSRRIPDIHQHSGDSERNIIGVHPIRGRPVGDRQMALDETSRLVIRAERTAAASLMELCGCELRVGPGVLTVGTPATRALSPAPVLHSRLVIIKGLVTEEEFLDGVRRQLDALEIEGNASLVPRRAERSLESRLPIGNDRSPWVRRTLRIRDREVVGYAVTVSDLDAESSIALQIHGIGGRRRFGCGVFVPVRDTPSA